MIAGGSTARTVPCLRPRQHRRHTWVTHPQSTTEYVCLGYPGDNGQPSLIDELTAEDAA